jgi:plasmid maintenance system antidote protein VapI
MSGIVSSRDICVDSAGSFRYFSLERRFFPNCETHIMPSIFEYTTYQEYLADFFAESKKSDRAFSHRVLAQELGISMPNLVLLVIQGKRTISANLAQRLVKVLKLRKAEAQYFENMIGFKQAKTHEAKNEHFMNMLKQRRAIISMNRYPPRLHLTLPTRTAARRWD